MALFHVISSLMRDERLLKGIDMIRNGFIGGLVFCLSFFGVMQVTASESIVSPRPVVQQNFQKMIADNACPDCDLAGANLNRVNMSGVNLQGANLAGAKLYLADLSGANLQNANLQGASLGGADLANADLRGANLTGALLEGAYLTGAQLDGILTTANPYQEKELAGVEETVFKENESQSKHIPYTQDLPVDENVHIEKRRDFNELPPITEPVVEDKEEALEEKISAGIAEQSVSSSDDLVMEKSKKMPLIAEAIVPEHQKVEEVKSSEMAQQEQAASSPVSEQSGAAETDEEFPAAVETEVEEPSENLVTPKDKDAELTIADNVSDSQKETEPTIIKKSSEKNESFFNRLTGFFKQDAGEQPNKGGVEEADSFQEREVSQKIEPALQESKNVEVTTPLSAGEKQVVADSELRTDDNAPLKNKETKLEGAKDSANEGGSFYNRFVGFFKKESGNQETDEKTELQIPEKTKDSEPKKLPALHDNVSIDATKIPATSSTPEKQASLIEKKVEDVAIVNTGAGYGTVRKSTGHGAEDRQMMIDRLLDTNRCVECNFEQANLVGVGLKAADLERANLRSANLQEIDLRKANLKKVDFQDADLRNADLRGADLYKANFNGANLTGARFDKAIVELTDFSGAVGVNLEGALQDK